MKTKQNITTAMTTLMTIGLMTIGLMTSASAQVSQDVLESISTPDKVKTSIGTLEFFDGAPSPETAEKAYDYLDTMRGVDTFLKGMPLASMHSMLGAQYTMGATEVNQVLIFDKLMDSASLYLTANTSSCFSTSFKQTIRITV